MRIPCVQSDDQGGRGDGDKGWIAGGGEGGKVVGLAEVEGEGGAVGGVHVGDNSGEASSRGGDGVDIVEGRISHLGLEIGLEGR